MAVICQKQPVPIQDLLVYQALIIEASLEYQGDSWMGYDQWFRQKAASLVQANTYPILWNLAFTGQASVSLCQHCFSLSHPTDHCDWAPEPLLLMSLLQHRTGIHNINSL